MASLLVVLVAPTITLVVAMSFVYFTPELCGDQSYRHMSSNDLDRTVGVRSHMLSDRKKLWMVSARNILSINRDSLT